MVWLLRTDKTGWLLAENPLGQNPVEKRIADIKLVNSPIP
jgi:hypothetical protein